MGYQLREEIEKIIDEALSFWPPEQLREEAKRNPQGGIVSTVLNEAADQLEMERLPLKIFRVDDC